MCGVGMGWRLLWITSGPLLVVLLVYCGVLLVKKKKKKSAAPGLHLYFIIHQLVPVTLHLTCFLISASWASLKIIKSWHFMPSMLKLTKMSHKAKRCWAMMLVRQTTLCKKIRFDKHKECIGKVTCGAVMFWRSSHWLSFSKHEPEMTIIAIQLDKTKPRNAFNQSATTFVWRTWLRLSVTFSPATLICFWLRFSFHCKKYFKKLALNGRMWVTTQIMESDRNAKM